MGAPEHLLSEIGHLLPTPVARTLCGVPERKLLVAVLEDAVHAYLHPLARKGREGGTRLTAEKVRADASAWLFGPSDERPFSFAHVCQELELAPAWVRRPLRTVARRRRKRPSP
jgi:hypothetical protein